MSDDSEARAILLDVEGTTTPIDYVYSVLFPYARTHVEAFLGARWEEPEVRVAVAGLAEAREREEDGAPAVLGQAGTPTVVDTAAFVRWLIDRDRKTTPLKTLQGLVWEEGFRAGDLVATVFDDVAPAFARWSAWRVRIASYSSGSVRAQRLLYQHSASGDLARFISAWFDTETGAKGEPTSYERIAASLGLAPREILFVSDVTAELTAARTAGLATRLALRPGNRPQANAEEFRSLRSFAEVVPNASAQLAPGESSG
jgi:enolase-phosphatase E1